jgi:LuxR family maltose regulon positive regulatory protein
MRAMGLADLGIAELWMGRFEEAERNLEAAVALARRIHRPLIELVALGHAALVVDFRSPGLADERSRRAIELADANGWADQMWVGAAYLALGALTLQLGRFDEAEAWLARAEHVLAVETEPVAAILLFGSRGMLELARGRFEEAQVALRTAARIGDGLVKPHMLASRVRAQLLLAMLRAGETERAERALDEVDEEVRGTPEMCVALAALRIAQDRADVAIAVLEPVLDSPGLMRDSIWSVQALLVEATAREALPDPTGESSALERALDLAEPGGLLLPFFLFPAAELLDRHRRAHTSHASLASEILAVLAGTTPASRPGQVEPLTQPLTDTEVRVLRYLPTNLRAPEIAAELYVSINTVRTHLRHLYAKLGANGRTDAVERARQLGLLSPSRGGC